MIRGCDYSTLGPSCSAYHSVSLENSALFYVGFVLLYVKTITSETILVDIPDVVGSALLMASSFFFLLHCVWFCKSHSGAVDLRITSLLLFFSIVNCLLTGWTSLLTAFLFVLAASLGVDKRRFVSVWFKMTLLLFIMLISLYLVLYIYGSPLATSVVRSEDGSNAVRLSFFFNHPNGAANMAMMLAGAFLYLNSDKKLKFTHYVFVLMTALLVLRTTDSRTAALLTAGLVPLFLIYQDTSLFERKWIRNLVAVLPFMLFVLTYLLASPLYSADTASLFTGRVWLWHTTLTNLGVTMLGRKFIPTSALSYDGEWLVTANTLDSFYASGILVMGLLASVLFAWAVFRSVRAAEGDELAFLPLLIVLLLHGFTETGVLTAAVSFPLVFLSIALKRKGGGGLVSRTRSAGRRRCESDV